MKNKTGLTTLTVVLFLMTSPVFAQTPASADLSLGTIDFPTSAEGEAQKEFLTGVLALHSFWYPEARDHFQKARELDPDFAMAYWGEALTHDHPIWEQHDQAAGQDILKALDKRSSLKKTDREHAYIEPVYLLFEPETDMDERRENYAEAMNEITRKYPGDDEALVLSALAEMSVSSYNYGNPDVRDVVPIAAKLEDLYQRNPEHPGAMHYLIHLYDNDKFAELGLRPADDYANVAYSSSHAIHMPSHIYKQMEMWDKVIESNIAAWEASVAWQKSTKRPLRDRDYHSYRWLFDAYLEIDNVEKACNMIENLNTLENQAKDNGEMPGRISRALNNFKSKYERVTDSPSSECMENP